MPLVLWFLRVLNIVLIVVFTVVIWSQVFRPPNDYHPYLPASRDSAFRNLESLRFGFVCEKQPPAVDLAPLDLPGSGSLLPALDYLVGDCISRFNGVLRLSLWGDDPRHLFEVQAATEGQRPPGLLARLARAAAVAASGPRPSKELVRWLTSATRSDGERSSDHFVATVVESEPTSRTISIGARDAETIARLLPRSSPSRPSDERLARTFAPVLHYTAGDYLPLSLEALRSRARLCLKKKGEIGGSHCRGFRLPTETPCGAATCTTSWVLDLPDIDERMPRTYAALEQQIRRTQLGRPVVYWHVAPVGHFRRILQYWIYYLFNDFHNVHEGDWETVQVDLVRWEGEGEVAALRWFFSSHQGGQVSSCSSIRCAHPDVHVAVGSHANYFKSGTHEVDVYCNERWRCYRVPGANDHARDTGKTLTSADYTLIEMKGPAYSGFYGPGNYKRSSLRRIPFSVEPDAPRDPRARTEWHRDPLASFAKARGEKPSSRQWYIISIAP
jgi:hypothetical protein